MGSDVTVILSYYHTGYEPWLRPCLESLVDPGGVKTLVMMTDRIQPELIHWANRRNVSLAAFKLQGQEHLRFQQFSGSPLLVKSARLIAYLSALRLIDVGGRFVAMDIDTLARRPIADLFNEASPAGLSMARVLRDNGRYTYLPAVLAGTASAMTMTCFDDWCRDIVRFGSQRQLLEQQYGSLEGGAWANVVARVEGSGGILLGQLPYEWCLEYKTVCAGKRPGIVHFSGKRPNLDEPDDSVGEDWLVAGKRFQL